MATPTHDLAIKTGEYQDRNGETKGRWLRIGTVFRHDDGGASIKLDAVPVGIPEWNGWVSVFPREAGQGAPAPAHAPARQPAPPRHNGGGRGGNGYGHPPPPGDFDDDIPF